MEDRRKKREKTRILQGAYVSLTFDFCVRLQRKIGKKVIRHFYGRDSMVEFRGGGDKPGPIVDFTK